MNYPDTWLRLKRTNDQFIGFASVDGNNWTQLSTATIAMSNRVYVGLAVTSQKTNQLATAVFDDFFVTPSGGTVDAITPATEPLGPSSRKTGLVISEIMYHPRDVFVGTNKLELEFVELFNSNPYYEDISGYRLAGDIDFTFPPNTIIQGGAFLVVAKIPDDVKAVYKLSDVMGPYAGSLKTSGTVRLRNQIGSWLATSGCRVTARLRQQAAWWTSVRDWAGAVLPPSMRDTSAMRSSSASARACVIVRPPC